ncbi:hypothetical protein EPIR_1550 [Erwinia piriflorinigrans CFBP 5888]|uniref:Uncharacterized protein n=1 Tax=Erwinia piriflorinigrans CFBP 5888 TaxID=1161919 RepID=V5Z7B0_9GAMM|nr:hypothetical protein EPIR_1550 [Erwinia piriflorinigrans CFBP 5888]
MALTALRQARAEPAVAPGRYLAMAQPLISNI